MNLPRPDPKVNEFGNPIHETDGEVLAYYREILFPERKDLADAAIENYWALRSIGIEINTARYDAIVALLDQARRQYGGE